MSRVPDYCHTVISVEEARRWMESGRAVVVDCRFELSDPEAGAAMYRARHLPGAVYWDLERDLSGPRTGTNGRHPLPELDTFAALLARSEITPQKQVILYDEWDGLNASRAWWLLHAAGFAAAAVLDGGIKAWQQAGLPLVKEEPIPPFRVQPPTLTGWQLPLADAETVRQAMDDPSVLLLDARAPERHRGEIEPFDPVPGHIPGSENRFFRANMDTQAQRFLPRERLREEFEALLAGRAAEAVIHYCGSGVTACHNLLAMVHAGFPFGRLYAGSWSEWCADPSRPVCCPAAQEHRQ